MLALPGAVPLGDSPVVGEVVDEDGLGGVALEGGVAVDVPDDGAGIDEVPVDGDGVDCASIVAGGIDAVEVLVFEVVA